MITTETLKRIIKEEVENFKVTEDASGKLGKISKDFSDMVMEKGNASSAEKSFFAEYVGTANAMAERYPGTQEGLLKSLFAAAMFFEENIEKFPVELTGQAKGYIEAVKNMKSNMIGIVSTMKGPL